ncbi:MAG TPA: ester cyclase [Kofleriaceae bacterium]|nr:ester cyclase [Kofleriaceae bacterium]
MTSDPVRTLVHRVVAEIFHGKKRELVDELYAPGYVGHQIPPPMPQNREGQKQLLAYFHSAFPDLELVFEDEVVEGQKLAGRGYFTGTHRGELMGVAPTGKKVKVAFQDLWRVEGGRIAEYWAAVDYLGLMRQLGALPG